MANRMLATKQQAATTASSALLLVGNLLSSHNIPSMLRVVNGKQLSLHSEWKRGFSTTKCLLNFKFSDLEISKARKPQPIPDHGKLVFGQKMTEHMLEVYWQSDRGWGPPTISDYHSLMLDPAAKCLHYSIEIFEGMKAYKGKDDTVRLFRPKENYKRMCDSAERACMPTFDINEMNKCVKSLVSLDKDWVPKAEGCSLYIRPTMIGIEPTLGVSSSNEVLLYVICSPVGPYFPSGMKPVSLLADSNFVRAWPGGSGASKMGANYGPTIYVQKQANMQGCQQVLWLFGDDHSVTEAGTMNIFVHLINESGETELVTPPLSTGVILPGVVRKSVLELAKSWGTVKVNERLISMHEVVKAQQESRLLEIFGSGTACVVCPVERILYMGKNIPVPTMETKDPVFQRLYKELNDIYVI